MFCGKCGTEINENAKFCPNCGTSVETNKNNEAINNLTQNKQLYQVPIQNEKKKKSKIWIIGGIIVLALFLGAICSGGDKNKNMQTAINEESSDKAVDLYQYRTATEDTIIKDFNCEKNLTGMYPSDDDILFMCADNKVYLIRLSKAHMNDYTFFGISVGDSIEDAEKKLDGIFTYIDKFQNVDGDFENRYYENETKYALSIVYDVSSSEIKNISYVMEKVDVLESSAEEQIEQETESLEENIDIFLDGASDEYKMYEVQVPMEQIYSEYHEKGYNKIWLYEHNIEISEEGNTYDIVSMRVTFVDPNGYFYYSKQLEVTYFLWSGEIGWKMLIESDNNDPVYDFSLLNGTYWTLEDEYNRSNFASLFTEDIPYTDKENELRDAQVFITFYNMELMDYDYSESATPFNESMNFSLYEKPAGMAYYICGGKLFSTEFYIDDGTSLDCISDEAWTVNFGIVNVNGYYNTQTVRLCGEYQPIDNTLKSVSEEEVKNALNNIENPNKGIDFASFKNADIIKTIEFGSWDETLQVNVTLNYISETQGIITIKEDIMKDYDIVSTEEMQYTFIQDYYVYNMYDFEGNKINSHFEIYDEGTHLNMGLYFEDNTYIMLIEMEYARKNVS